MAWQFRKSIRVGPFSINFSKRGVGVSAGIPGIRETVGADGKVRSTVNIPGTGISYPAPGGLWSLLKKFFGRK